MRKALTALLGQCDAGATKGNCPIIHALAAD
jgi:MerR family mercuric resistance operon transcriptional regulator